MASGTLDASVTRVILADSQPLMLDGLEHLLASQDDMRVMAAVGDGLQLVETVKRYVGHMDVVVMDFNLPEANGRACLQYIRWQRWPVKVVVLVGPDNGEAIRQALVLEADGLVFRTAPSEQILTAVRQVAADQLIFPSAARRWLRPVAPILEQLSEREAAVLALVAEGLTNSQIAERLFVSTNTVKFHLKNIFEKLGVVNRVEASQLYQRYSVS